MFAVGVGIASVVLVGVGIGIGIFIFLPCLAATLDPVNAGVPAITNAEMPAAKEPREREGSTGPMLPYDFQIYASNRIFSGAELLFADKNGSKLLKLPTKAQPTQLLQGVFTSARPDSGFSLAVKRGRETITRFSIPAQAAGLLKPKSARLFIHQSGLPRLELIYENSKTIGYWPVGHESGPQPNVVKDRSPSITLHCRGRNNTFNAPRLAN